MVDLMQGQFKGTVQCSSCKYQKDSFEPFSMVQLPIPHVIKIEFFFVSRHRPQDSIFYSEI